MIAKHNDNVKDCCFSSFDHDDDDDDDDHET